MMQLFRRGWCYLLVFIVVYSVGKTNSEKPLSGVVLTTGKDTRVFEISIHSALKHLVDIDKFYIVSPNANSLHDRLSKKLGNRVTFVDEKQFPFTLDNVTKVMFATVKQKGERNLSKM